MLTYQGLFRFYYSLKMLLLSFNGEYFLKNPVCISKICYFILGMICGVLETDGELSILRFLSFFVSTQRFLWTDIFLPVDLVLVAFARTK